MTALLLEAYRAARSQFAGSAIVGLVVAAVAAVILITTGQTAATEKRVLDRIDEAGSRTLEISAVNSKDEFLRTNMLPVIWGLPSTEVVAGLSTATDGRNAALGEGAEPIAFWTYYGDVDALNWSGRSPRPGEALVGERALHRWGEPAGLGTLALPDQRQAAVVGTFTANDSLSTLTEGGIIVGRDDVDVPIQRMLVTARSAKEVGGLTAEVLEIVAPSRPDAVQVLTPVALADLQAVVAGDLGSFGRDLLAGVLAAGSLLVALSVLGQVLLRRRDLGRRRALGANRGTLIALVLLQTTYAAISGVVVGVAVGLLATHQIMGALPDLSFVIGSATLAVLAASLAALPAAVAAAWRDPIAVLRTP
jgi:putative ABC transport system permease protein